MNFARFTTARTIADAVLFEGYLLYPYRASAPKNRARWQFGVAAPPRWAKVRGTDTDVLEVTFLVEAERDAEIAGQLRFLHLRRRRVEQAASGGHRFVAVPSLEVGSRLYLPWEEGDVREVAIGALLSAGPTAGAVTSFRFPGTIETQPLKDADGVLHGRVVREALPLSGRVIIEATRLSDRLHRIKARVENHSDFTRLDGPREEAMRASLLGTHLLLAAQGGRFLSLVDPPPFAQAAAKACKNVGLFPVLVEEDAGQDVLLASPIILEDHPRVAPESRGDFYDSSEIDELLTLRTMTLTEVEKREMRATDDRAAAILDRVEGSPTQRLSDDTLADTLSRLHGTFRDMPVASRFPPGARVRLRPGPRRTDAQDMFLRGMTATVEAVMQDVDGRDCLAVTVDADPATELYRAQGRYLYFYEDEVEAP
jgi:hypothetical protein